MPFSNIGTENGAPIYLHYEDHGEGSPVVLMHGWPTSARSWEKQIGSLVDHGYRGVTYDRRGFGRSAHPWDGYDYQTLAHDLQLLIEDVDLTDVTLVGACMAGGEVVRHERCPLKRSIPSTSTTHATQHCYWMNMQDSMQNPPAPKLPAPARASCRANPACGSA